MTSPKNSPNHFTQDNEVVPHSELNPSRDLITLPDPGQTAIIAAEPESRARDDPNLRPSPKHSCSKDPLDTHFTPSTTTNVPHEINAIVIPPAIAEEPNKSQQEPLDNVFLTIPNRSLQNLLRQFPQEKVKRLLLSEDPQDKKLLDIFSDPDKYFEDDEDLEPPAKNMHIEFVIEGYPPMPMEDSEDEDADLALAKNLFSDDENSDGNELDFPDTDEEVQFVEEEDDNVETEPSSDDDFDE